MNGDPLQLAPGDLPADAEPVTLVLPREDRAEIRELLREHAGRLERETEVKGSTGRKKSLLDRAKRFRQYVEELRLP